jgi:pyruvate,water dikinase
MNSSPSEQGSGLYTVKDLEERGLKIRPSLRRTYKKAGNFKVYREQISSLYIYGYGQFRKLFLKLGKDLKLRGIIDSEYDIFFLWKEEIDDVINNIETLQINRYQDLIQKRKNEMEETKDIVLPSVIYGEEAPILERGRVKNHSGIGTSPGIFSGKTRDDFDKVCRGDILLIPFSDVSWTPILVKAGAIVSETGGMLSHCSIIAREMGIPALVSVENACALGSGLTATVNGSNGVLTIHDYE